MHPDKKLIIALSAALLVLSTITAALLYTGHPLASNSAGVPMPSAPRSADGLMHVLTGTVVAVGSGTLTVSAILPGAVYPVSVAVTVPAGAELTLQTPKDPAVLEREMSLDQERLAREAASSTPSTLMPPPAFASRAISLSDITVGAFVTITPVANTKEGATAVLAQAIAVQGMPVVPPSSAAQQ